MPSFREVATLGRLVYSVRAGVALASISDDGGRSGVIDESRRSAARRPPANNGAGRSHGRNADAAAADRAPISGRRPLSELSAGALLAAPRSASDEL
ncbi:hypothetical protein EVAR_64101_1 [Eumeta japonica]|uniref:Uncharacterized protein n=1 Tax=Eumeta variegata TaxID=151549 RepID=A0A4C1ZHS8_EUMVA|nr:hypothetical protein EVAR_64101_1 [Eumeta japonica]